VKAPASRASPRSTPEARPPPSAPSPAAAALEAHPIPTLVADRDLRVVAANAAARSLLGAREGMLLGDALSCVDARNPGGCGTAIRCASCAFRGAAQRALAGETVRDRGFVLRGESALHGDLHLFASAGPLEHGGARLAVLALQDANAILGDPGILRVCEACGRVKDEEGGWHPLHRYLEDRLGLESSGPLCPHCAEGQRGR
jgi:PAS domain-containing protein